MVMEKALKSIKNCLSGDRKALTKIKIRIQLKCELADGHIRSISYLDVVSIREWSKLAPGYIKL